MDGLHGHRVPRVRVLISFKKMNANRESYFYQQSCQMLQDLPDGQDKSHGSEELRLEEELLDNMKELELSLAYLDPLQQPPVPSYHSSPNSLPSSSKKAVSSS